MIMEPVASGTSNKLSDTIRQLEGKGSISVFLIPPLPTQKRKDALDKTSHNTVSVKELKGSNPTVSKTRPEVLICREVITIKENRFTNTNMSLTDDEFPQSLEEAETATVVQPEDITDNISTSTNVIAKIPSPELLATSEVKAEGEPDTEESQSCSSSSSLNDLPADVKTDDSSFKPSPSETQYVPIPEGRISEKMDTSFENSSENDCPVTHLDYQKHVDENSYCQQRQYTPEVPHKLPFHNVSKEVENTTERPVSSLAVPDGGMSEKRKLRSGPPTKLHSISAALKNLRSRRCSGKYSLRTSRQQPVRYVNVEPSGRHTKVAKTQWKQTIKITLPSLPGGAETRLLRIFYEMAKFHGCEISFEGNTLDMPELQWVRSQGATDHQRNVVPAPYSALCTQSFDKYQQGSIARSSQHYPTANSVIKKVQTKVASNSQPGSCQLSQYDMETLQAKLQSLGTQLKLPIKLVKTV